MKRTSSLLIIGIILVVLVGAWTGYLFYKEARATSQLKNIENSLVQLNTKVSEFKDQEVLAAINAKRALPVFEGAAVKWSDVVNQIQDVIPKSGGELIVQILSYSGSSANNISLNIKTTPGTDDPYLKVSELIEAFDASEMFGNAFVPSISSGLDDEGRKILTFILSVDFLGELMKIPDTTQPVTR